MPQRTMVLVTASGAQVAAKPRSLRPELALAALLRDLDAVGIVRCPTYRGASTARATAGRRSWLRAIPAMRAASPLCSRDSARVAHALRAGDLHADNVLVCGERLAVVDAECLLAPDLGGRASTPCERSVLDTGVVPFVDPVHGRDLSPLRRLLQGAAGAPPGNAHEDAGGVREGFVAAAVQDGFSSTYAGLMSLRDTHMRARDALAELEVRIVLRPTLAYTGLLAQLVHDGSLGLGVDVGVLRRLHPSSRRPDLAGLTNSEAADLAAGDVPRFTGRAGSPAVHHHRDGWVQGVLSPAAVPTVADCLRRLRSEDLELQRRTIAASLAIVPASA